MGYDSKHTQIVSSQEGYNLIAQDYSKYHKHLDTFYNIDIRRFLPSQEGLKIIDLGAGDGRLLKEYKGIDIGEYLACDISSKILEHHPKGGNIKTKVVDLEQVFDLEDNSFDFATSFFVLEHIDNLQNFFQETYRILKPGGRLLIGYFLQRREFKRKKDRKDFKIKQYKYKLEDLKKLSEETFFDFHYFESRDKGVLLGYIIVCEKN